MYLMLSRFIGAPVLLAAAWFCLGASELHAADPQVSVQPPEHPCEFWFSKSGSLGYGSVHMRGTVVWDDASGLLKVNLEKARGIVWAPSERAEKERLGSPLREPEACSIEIRRESDGRWRIVKAEETDDKQGPPQGARIAGGLGRPFHLALIARAQADIEALDQLPPTNARFLELSPFSTQTSNPTEDDEVFSSRLVLTRVSGSGTEVAIVYTRPEHVRAVVGSVWVGGVSDPKQAATASREAKTSAAREALDRLSAFLESAIDQDRLTDEMVQDFTRRTSQWNSDVKVDVYVLEIAFESGDEATEEPQAPDAAEDSGTTD